LNNQLTRHISTPFKSWC